jgi:hypothetical protein
MLLLHTWTPGHRPADQVATWDAVQALEDRTDLVVLHRPTFAETSYAEAWRDVWDAPGIVLGVEQDIVPTPWHVAELVACPGGYCAWDYRLANGQLWSEVPEGRGFGLVKFTRAARMSVLERPMVPLVPWRDVASVISSRVGPPHVHQPPVRHNHVG